MNTMSLPGAPGCGFRLIDTGLDTFGPAMAATRKFFFPFNFLVSHNDTPRFHPPHEITGGVDPQTHSRKNDFCPDGILLETFTLSMIKARQCFHLL